MNDYIYVVTVETNKPNRYFAMWTRYTCGFDMLNKINFLHKAGNITNVYVWTKRKYAEMQVDDLNKEFMDKGIHEWQDTNN